MAFANVISDTLKKWWLVLIAGILAIILGVKALFSPVDSFATLSTICVIILIVSGIVKAVNVIKNRNEIPAWGWNLVAALLYVLLGILILSLPLGKDLLLAFMAGFAVTFEGINQIFNAFALKQYEGSGWGWVLALGIITIILGISLISSPIFSMAFVVYFFAFGFIFVGIDLIAASIALSKMKAAVDMGKKAVDEAMGNAEEK